MSKKLSEITSKFDSLAKQNEEVTSQVTVAQNTSKEAFKTTNSKLVEHENSIINWNSIRGRNAWNSQAFLAHSHRKT